MWTIAKMCILSFLAPTSRPSRLLSLPSLPLPPSYSATPATPHSRVSPSVHMMIRPNVDRCTSNSDCMLPEVCCEGWLFSYCCDLGGRANRIRLPNVTFPSPSPVPVPVPVPVPLDSSVPVLDRLHHSL